MMCNVVRRSGRGSSLYPSAFSLARASASLRPRLDANDEGSFDISAFSTVGRRRSTQNGGIQLGFRPPGQWVLMQINEHGSTVQSAVGRRFRSIPHIIMNFPTREFDPDQCRFCYGVFLNGRTVGASASFMEPSDGA